MSRQYNYKEIYNKIELSRNNGLVPNPSRNKDTPREGQERRAGFVFHFRHTVLTMRHAPGSAGRHLNYIGRPGTEDEPHEWISHDGKGLKEARDELSAVIASTRKNGRIMEKMTGSLPLGLSRAEAQACAVAFMKSVAVRDGRSAPWFLALHLAEGNPHFHAVFVDRDKTTGRRVFGCSERGSTWRLRCEYARALNKALEAAGLEERTDPRSYKSQGLSIVPGQHEGPWKKRKAIEKVSADLVLRGGKRVGKAVRSATRELLDIATN